tara:strand:- start:525 stop:1244 length:720 start_codon:yes stop_codon:yes gene_type:complete
MPKTKIDYSKTVIYKIVCDDDNITDLYVGSTTEFVKRKYQHKNACNNQNNRCYNLKLYETIRENGGWENWRMIEVEKFPCNDKRQAECREEYWRKNLKAELNNQKCWRDPICLESDCKNGARHGNEYCIKHGGGRRCLYQDCKNGAARPTDYCVKHGGGKRCKEPDCKQSAINKTNYCVKHGGGNRCLEPNCKSGAERPTDYCKKHGEQYTCECGSTLSIKSKNRHNKSKKHQKYLNIL